MSKNLEIESKVMLNEDEYQSTKEYLKKFKVDEYEQINYYLDSKDFDIAKNHASLRIRYKKNQYEMTFKINQKVGKLELNYPLSEKEFNNFSNSKIINNGEICDILNNFSLNPSNLIFLTSLKTRRIDASINECLVSLDKNEYNNIVDFEIEVEGKTLEEATNTMKKICEVNHIFYEENKKSKQFRAISTIKK